MGLSTAPRKFGTRRATQPAVVAAVVGAAFAVCALGGCKDRAADPSATAPDCPAPVASDSPAAAGLPGPAPAAAGLAGAAPADGQEPAPAGGVPFVECPVFGEAQRDLDALLDTAGKQFTAGQYAAAYWCAEVAVDVEPQSVEAHHLRAAAASALGHVDVAQRAFTLALAIDPDDPETLAAAAEFYINALPLKLRENTLVGLEYARRGRVRAVTRRRANRRARARLALLEAQAYNDLGLADEALARADEALELAPDLAEARHERGVAMFSMCQFDGAQQAFLAMLRHAPDDPYAHHHLGLIYERKGRLADAQAHFARAQALAPDEFWAPVMASEADYRAEIERVVAELPADQVAALEQVSIEIADLPAIEDLTAVEPSISPTILGLFRGLPLGAEAPGGLDAPPPPDRAIVLYRNNLGRAVKSREELNRQIRRTLLHEIGHLYGLDEDALRHRGLD